MSGTGRRIRSVESESPIQLSWSGAPDGAGSGVSADRIHREVRAEGPLDFAASGTSTTDRSATAGASNVTTVHAFDTVGNESGAGNAVSLTLGGKSGGNGGGGSGGSGGGRGGGKGKNKNK